LDVELGVMGLLFMLEVRTYAKSVANRVKGNLEKILIDVNVDVISERGVLTGKPHEVRDESTGKVYKAKVRREASLIYPF